MSPSAEIVYFPPAAKRGPRCTCVSRNNELGDQWKEVAGEHYHQTRCCRRKWPVNTITKHVVAEGWNKGGGKVGLTS